MTNARWASPAIKVFSVLWPGQARALPLRARVREALAAAEAAPSPLGGHVRPAERGGVYGQARSGTAAGFADRATSGVGFAIFGP